MRVIGLDIGGANLKASDGERQSTSRAFAIWQHPEQLGAEIQRLLGEFERPQHLAVTITAELADCFATKAEGVERILTAVETAVDQPVHVWQRGGEFVSPTDAREFPMLVAAANWHALATWAGRMTPAGVALLMDMGSTTTDIIPIVDGLPATDGGTDLERLRARELVYTGFRRTPLCAVSRLVVCQLRSHGWPGLERRQERNPGEGTPGASLRSSPGHPTDNIRIDEPRVVVSNGSIVPLAAELFATTQDVALILGDHAEDAEDCDTADGRPATIEHARSRLARMLCCDRTELDDNQLQQIAGEFRDMQQRQIGAAVRTVLATLPRRAGDAHSRRAGDVSPPITLLLSGEGEHVLRQVVGAIPALTDCETTSLRDVLGPEHSTAACAYALARLAAERIH